MTGSVFLNSTVLDLGDLTYVGGNLHLHGTNISNLNSLNEVLGNLNLPKELKGSFDTDKIKIHGKVRYLINQNINKNHKYIDRITKVNANKVPFWDKSYLYKFEEIYKASIIQQDFYFNTIKKDLKKFIHIDLEGSNNYLFVFFFDIKNQYEENILNEIDYAKYLKFLIDSYPKFKSYFIEDLINIYQKNNDWEKAWEEEKEKGIHTGVQHLKDYYTYSRKLNRLLIDKNNLIQIIGISSSNTFTRKNMKDILFYFDISLRELLSKNNVKDFWQLFLPSEEPLERYAYDYYAQFNDYLGWYQDYKLDEKEFNKQIKNKVDLNKTYRIESPYFPKMIDMAIRGFLEKVLELSENKYRNSRGLKPKEKRIRWKSEFELYELLKNKFHYEKVLFQASPKWLGKQTFDIYIPDKSIAVEYQGRQHYEPIDFFGGVEAFKKNQERDKRKLMLAEKNDCLVIYVDNGYSLDEVCKIIEKKMFNRNEYRDSSLIKTKKILKINSKIKSVKVSNTEEIYDCKEQKIISLENLKLQHNTINIDYFINQNSVYGRYILKDKMKNSKILKQWKTIKNIEDNTIERHSLKTFSEKLNVNQTSVWGFFNGRQKKFKKKYMILN